MRAQSHSQHHCQSTSQVTTDPFPEWQQKLSDASLSRSLRTHPQVTTDPLSEWQQKAIMCLDLLHMFWAVALLSAHR